MRAGARSVSGWLVVREFLTCSPVADSIERGVRRLEAGVTAPNTADADAGQIASKLTLEALWYRRPRLNINKLLFKVTEAATGIVGASRSGRRTSGTSCLHKTERPVMRLDPRC